MSTASPTEPHTEPYDPAARAVPAQVRAARTVSPHLRRITLAGDPLHRLEPRGADQWFRLFLPRRGADLVLPVGPRWWPEVLALPEEVRPAVRSYTVRAARPEVGEVDVDVVLHDGGVASSWAACTEPGDPVGLLDQGVRYDPYPGTDWQLLVGDETALPAVAGIVAGLPYGTHALVLVELPDAADAQPLPEHEGVEVTWLPRRRRDRPGSLAVAAVRDGRFPAGRPYVWLAGECGMVRALRRHLVRVRGVPKCAITFTGYWRTDRFPDRDSREVAG